MSQHRALLGLGPGKNLRFCRLFFTGEFEAWEAAKMVTKKPGVEDWFFSLAP